MVATERAFAATSIKEGIRASFLKFFAESCLAFSPAPYIYKQAVAKSHPPADPLARTLYWEPIEGDVALSGDLGYTMGPSSLKDHSSERSPVHYGFYFSIWKRQPDDTWKVIVDIGTDVTENVNRFFGQEFSRAGSKSRVTPGRAPTPSTREELLAQDTLFSAIAAGRGTQQAYEATLDDSARALREGAGPLIGKDAILALMKNEQGIRSLDPMDAGVSLAGDLGYTYGAYRTVQDSPEPAGYYVRVWKKNATGLWKLVVDKIAPREEK